MTSGDTGTSGDRALLVFHFQSGAAVRRRVVDLVSGGLVGQPGYCAGADNQRDEKRSGEVLAGWVVLAALV